MPSGKVPAGRRPLTASAYGPISLHPSRRPRSFALVAANSTRLCDAYVAAFRAAALYDASGRGRILFTGPDHLDFLHRMSTNGVIGSRVGDRLKTVFCDSRGRIVQVASLSRTADEATTAFVEDAPGLLAWLERYHFSERMEQIDISSATGQLELVGPGCAEAFRAALGEDPEGSAGPGLPLGERSSAMRLQAGGQLSLRLWGPREEIDGFRRRLLAVGVPRLDAHAWEVLRVEWGQPAAGRELTLDHNPWEAGLGEAVHMDKGCYIGQEVVARLDTYQKVKQHLVGLRLADEVRSGARVEAGGRVVGAVTSAAASERLGPLALAYVRTAHCRPGTPLSVEGTEAEVSALPFDAAPPGSPRR